MLSSEQSELVWLQYYNVQTSFVEPGGYSARMSSCLPIITDLDS